jgi:hypothetical protein
MKKQSSFLIPAILGLGLLTAQAQFGPPGGAPQGPSFGGAMDKLFGENQTYTANLEFQSTDKSGESVAMPGKISFDNGKSRFEMNMSEIKSAKMSPETGAQMKQMGMDQMISINQPDKKVVFLVYPGMQSYVENKMTDAKTGAPMSDFKIEVTELGKETMDGHPCVKNKVIVTDKDGVKHESTVWNATDLKNFPVKIQTEENGSTVTMSFKNVSLAKPDASAFEVPAGYTKYDSMQAMMQQQMMKRMGGGGSGGFFHLNH